MLALGLALTLLVAGGGPIAQGSGKRALLVQGETLTLGALEPQVTFPDGPTIATTRVGRAAALVPTDNDQILLYDLQADEASTVEEADLARQLISPTEPPTTLREIFTEVGTVVLFETPAPASSPDPDKAGRYQIYWPSRPPAIYYAEFERLLACVCGDVSGEGMVNFVDSEQIRFALADSVGSGLSGRARACCSVIGPSGVCDIADVAVIIRASSGFIPDTAPVCSVALSP